ncbi:DUF6894 family protein [Mesorhizobium australicum]|uniref:DUF6894 family protein n=1 Tax=Mesorhizobium australicum TaxID=536018 RepID=UPI0033377548
MPTYHFDYRDNDKMLPDELGSDIADLETARLEAVKTLAELARGIDRPDHQILSIEVREGHKPLLKVSLTLNSGPVTPEVHLAEPHAAD